MVIAAIEAVCTDEFNMHGVLATTYFPTPVLIVNGPIRNRIGMNYKMNVLGQGNRANATIGRALQLIVRNVGGGRPGEVDRAALGQPGKYTFCCAEYEERSNWEPLPVERGFKKDQSTVTIYAGGAPNGVIDQLSRGAKSLATTMKMQKSVSPYTNYGLNSAAFNLGTAWQSYSIELTTSGFTGTVSDGMLMFWLAPYDAAGDQYYIDDVAVQKVSSGPTAPTITTQPANQTVTEGQTATFSVVASGTAPLTYQWQKNGIDITGATGASYTTPAVVLADSGTNYQCVVSNSAGSVTSNAVALTVTVTAAPTSFVLFDKTYSHTGANRLYDHWDFVPRMAVQPGSPRNWISPVNYYAGQYKLRVEVLEMQPLSGRLETKPILSVRGDMYAYGIGPQDISVIDPSSGTEKLRIRTDKLRVHVLAFGRENMSLFIGGQRLYNGPHQGMSEQVVEEYSLRDGKLLRSIVTGHLYELSAIEFRKDTDLLVTASGDKTIELRNLATGALVSTLGYKTNQVHSIAVRPDGKNNLHRPAE